MRKTLTAIGLSAGLLVPAAPAHGQGQTDRRLDRVQGPTTVAAHGEHVMWVRPSGNRYGLVHWPGSGEPKLLRAWVTTPFEFDLGEGPGGETVAVYTRCTRRFRGCDIRLLDLDTGRGRTLRGAASARYSEVKPTIHRNRIAFLRIPDGGRRRGRSLMRLYVSDLDGRDKPRRLPLGPTGNLPAGGLPSGSTDRLDLGPLGVAFAWSWLDVDVWRWHLLLDDLRGGQHTIDETESGESGLGSALSSASSGDAVAWLRKTDADDLSERFVLRRRETSGTVSELALPCRTTSVSTADVRLAYVRTPYGCGGSENGMNVYDVWVSSR